MKNHDIIIFGRGLASLSVAARLVELGKNNIGIYANGNGGTPYIAAINFVLPDNPYGDTSEQYAEDMLNAGCKIGNTDLVREMAANTYKGYEMLLRLGIQFAKNSDKTVKLRHVSGHTYPRSLCSTTELIGIQMARKLRNNLVKNGVKFYDDCECLKLLSDGKQVYGATVCGKNKNIRNVYAPVTVAAWGGVGNLFAKSTYPQDIQGNTLAIAKEAGAKLVDVEFLEYEPMVVIYPRGASGEPCPTAMLGEGGYLINSLGERFLLKVRPQGEAGSPKTLINQQIWKEVKSGRGSPHGGVWVDLRHIDREVLKSYPWFFNRMMANGADPNKELIEVGPMAHSFSGGILVDKNYCSSLKNFYAVGEACGGVHGACRCAGNAASEAVISGMLCAQAIASAQINTGNLTFPVDYAQDNTIYKKYVHRIKANAAQVLGIYRNGEDLKTLDEQLQMLLSNDKISNDEKTCQIVISIKTMAEAAFARRESRGSHMRIDYPQMDSSFQKEIII